MTACADLVSGVSHLAHNTALGMAAICGQTPDPLPDLPPASAILTSRLSDTIGAVGVRDLPEIASPGTSKRMRRFAPHAAAEFAIMDALGIEALEAALPRPAIQGATGTDGVGEAHAKLSDNGGRVSGGYLFFDDDENLAASAEPQIPEDGANSGEASDEVSGDLFDDMDKSYDLTSDALLSRGGITLSGGFSSVEGVSIGGKIARLNLGGENREIAASARYSKVRQTLEIGYADGNFMGGSLGFAPTIFARRNSAKGFGNGFRSTPFAQSSYGITAVFSRKFGESLAVSASYNLSADAFRMRGKASMCDASQFGSPLCNAIGGTTNSLASIAFAFDRRERDGIQTRGFRLRLAQDAGLGGSAPFSRTRLGGEAHIGLGDDWTLLLDIEGGYLASIGKRAIPLFDRFYAGDTSLRGFDLRGVGPKVRPTGALHGQNVAIGGRIYYAARAELSGSVGGLFDRLGVQPGLFIDAGSVFGANSKALQPGETLLGNSAKPRLSAGIGLAMKTPAGTFRFDIAKPLVKQPGDRTQTFAISFGGAI